MIYTKKSFLYQDSNLVLQIIIIFWWTSIFNDLNWCWLVYALIQSANGANFETDIVEYFSKF